MKDTLKFWSNFTCSLSRISCVCKNVILKQIYLHLIYIMNQITSNTYKFNIKVTRIVMDWFVVIL